MNDKYLRNRATKAARVRDGASPKPQFVFNRENSQRERPEEGVGGGGGGREGGRGEGEEWIRREIKQPQSEEVGNN